MVTQWFRGVILIVVSLSAVVLAAEKTGGIRGTVYDIDFDAPLAAVQVLIAETAEGVVTTDEGNYVFGQVQPGTYTLVFSKDGYTRRVKADVVVLPEQMTEVNASLSGEFEEMEEFVVQDVQIGAGTEAALLDLRMESPAMTDSIGSELMSRAGAGDAAAALKLVAGASVQDGKYAVIRGLPDRYVNSQMNGVRLPTADTDKRAVQLDQFPSAAIESIQVSKTFTPDQQGDASGGAVNVILKGIPNESVFKLDLGTGWNTQTLGSDFLTYKGGGVSFFGQDGKKIPADPSNYEAAGVSTGNSPLDYKWSVAGGNKHQFENGLKIGGFGSYFYERDSSYYDNGIEDSYWLESSGGRMVPQGGEDPQINNEFNTSLFDVTQSSEELTWGGLGLFGVETENHFLSVLYMFTQNTEDKTTLAENTRGKAYYFPGHDPSDPSMPGFIDDTDGDGEGDTDFRLASPYLRAETLEYTERTTRTLQFRGRHKLPELEWGVVNIFTLLEPEVDWTVSMNAATLYQPDKRQLGSLWRPGLSDIVTPWGTISRPAVYLPYQPAANVNIGNFQRIWKDVYEGSDQYALNLKTPFEQWTGDEGYFKFGVFNDQVNRTYEQDTFQNRVEELPGEGTAGTWEEYWSKTFDYPMYKSNYDIDYEGEQTISAWYYMVDLPVNSFFNVIGGARYEKTELSITNDPYDPASAKLIYPGSSGMQDYDPEKANVQFQQDDVLPSIGFVFKPVPPLSFRGSYSETVARQTFKELSPITQMEYLGGDVFVGNPELKMSSLKNYDLRADYTPYEGGLISVSYFWKDIVDPIEYVQRFADFAYTTPRNYPEGKISGFEIEGRQELGRFWDSLEGFSLGANATIINSEVTLPEDEKSILESVNAPMSKRDMTNAPAHLYNFFAIYDAKKTGTQLALFYTIRGDTLVTGAGQSESFFIPSVYETEYGTLNFSLSQKLGEIWTLKFQAKNLLNPAIDTVYRSKYIGDDVMKSSYTKGVDFSISLSATF